MDNKKSSKAKDSNTIQKSERVKLKFGKEILSNEELLILMSESIIRSYTFEEKGYK